MASKAGAYVAVLAGGVMAYSAFTHKRIIDVLLMRPSTLPQDNYTQGGTGGTAGSSGPVVATGNMSDTTTLRQAVCNAAIQAANEPVGTYVYAMLRPYPPNLFGPPTPVKLDCSSFATLSYKYGGAPDPNQLGYSGAGYTGTLMVHGRTTVDPQPADLAFWSNPDHVAVYIGNGQIVEFGGGSGPIDSTVTAENAYHSRFLGYRTYLPL